MVPPALANSCPRPARAGLPQGPRHHSVRWPKAGSSATPPTHGTPCLNCLGLNKPATEEIRRAAAHLRRQGRRRGARSRMYSPGFRGRVMVPICNDYGEVIGFSGGVLDADAKTAKYVNSPETPLLPRGGCFMAWTNPSGPSSRAEDGHRVRGAV